MTPVIPPDMIERGAAELEAAFHEHADGIEGSRNITRRVLTAALGDTHVMVERRQPSFGRSKQSRVNEILLRMFEDDKSFTVQDFGGPNVGEQYRPAFITLENNGWVARERSGFTNKYYYHLTATGRERAKALAAQPGEDASAAPTDCLVPSSLNQSSTGHSQG